MVGLELRGGVWKYRKAIPSHLCPLFDGAFNIIRSLGTPNLSAAQRRYPAAKADVDRLLAEAELAAVHRWLDNWSGIGLIATGMERQGYRLHLTNVDPGVWRATFSSHPMLSAEGFGAAPTPWGAVQEAAWHALKDVDAAGAP